MNNMYKTALAALIAATVWAPPGSAYAAPQPDLDVPSSQMDRSGGSKQTDGTSMTPSSAANGAGADTAADDSPDLVAGASGTAADHTPPVLEDASPEAAGDETVASQTAEPSGVPNSSSSGSAQTPDSRLILTMNSDQAQQHGRTYTSPRPTTVREGVSYVGIRFLTERLGGTVAYDAGTGETVVRVSGRELRYRTDSASYSVDGAIRTMRGTVYADRNHLMVPLTSLTSALGLRYAVEGKTILLQLADKPVASFEVSARKIAPGQQITYTPSATSPQGLAIVDERWEGWQPSYDVPGTYTISYYVQDAAGTWSDPYTVTIEVEAPYVPPVAQFSTDKEVYRMGELVRYTDRSTDEQGVVVERKWDNNKPAFFEPGLQTVTLVVTDTRGASSTFSKVIRITEEMLYTQEEFALRHTPAGSNMPIDNLAVLQIEALPYRYTTESQTLFRSSGPESVFEDGVLYEDVIRGEARFLLHHKNRMDKRAKLYLVAENTGPETAVLRLTGEGLAGPTPYAEIAGRMSLGRYLASEAAGGTGTIRLAPGERVLLFDSLTQAKALSPGDIVTFTGSVSANGPIRYSSLLIAEDREPLDALGSLPRLDPKESIIRGTFAEANRVFRYDEPIGGRPLRLPLTDNTTDPFQRGTDGIMGSSTVNSGNYGVMYKLRLNRVEPHTVIAFNPRGGLYVGSARVNGEVVGFSHLGMSSATREASVLYRTGDRAEAVDIWISPSAGSNLPFTLLFLPMPEERS
ncbi:stalk domain-containing protein [Paenibacillus sp. 1P07SE]|uniref:stalk domain-containing protein n=1 Tax=Paenibacillus sp. 1P07SE TaxID=3132209 RepID=UPI0039A62EC5